MREIKFRAWNVEEKCWIKCFYPLFNGYDEGQGGHWLEGVQGDHDEDLMVANGEVILMQYTGLKDKNSKEIYEGDIVRATANGNRKYQIVWIDYGLGHWWIADIKRDNLIPNKIPINLNAIEVIGNIMENPELLEEAH
jgi:uncharacterized phage protein (TIGR01671 family)